MNSTLATIRVGIVEDRAAEIEALERLLSNAPGFASVAACRNATEALTVLPRAKPNVVLMDIQLPGLSGIDCVSQVRPFLPQAQIMMLTVVEDHELIFQSLAAGAMGYILKKTPPEKLLEAIRELHEGGAPMSGQIARQVVSAFGHTLRPVPATALLSPVEQAVLQRLARGLLYKEVAEELRISVSTVRTHVWHIYGKLHVHNRTEALLKALPGR